MKKNSKTAKTQKVKFHSVKSHLLRNQSWIFRTMFYLGCFKDKGVKWKMTHDGVCRPESWTLKPRYYHPLILSTILVLSIGAIVEMVARVFWDFFKEWKRTFFHNIIIRY